MPHPRGGVGLERVMLLDFKRAFLYGACERELYIELPEDDPKKQGGRNVGILLNAMYGMRDAHLCGRSWSRPCS